MLQSFKKYPKDWAIVLTVITLGIFAVMGWHWTDTAKTPFWWHFWQVAAIVSAIVLIGAWVYAWKTQKKGKR